ncbi:MAG: twin-arginine translocase subunit TatC [Leptospirales bacterium]|jgi:sec-independent protein translocase protein TatC
MADARKPARNQAASGKKTTRKTAGKKKPGTAATRKKKTASKQSKRPKSRSPGRGVKKSARKKSIPRVVPTGKYRTGRSAPPGETPTDDSHIDDYASPGTADDPTGQAGQPPRDERSDLADSETEAEYEQPGYDHLPDPLDEEDRDEHMSVGEHLEELRIRIFWMIGVIAGLSAVAGFFSGTLHDYLVAPYSSLTDQNLILQNVYGPMEIFIKVSVLAGVIVGFPALVFILWGFVTPAVTRRTAIYGHLAVASSALLFWTGIAVCWLYILPLSLQFFFVGMQMDGVDPVLSVERYYGFIFALHLATGLAFQLPIVLIALGAFGILTVAWHKRTWRFALVTIYISSAIITPPDPWSMIGVGTLLSVLYVFSIGVVWLIERGRK